jgi:hypothetical protein
MEWESLRERSRTAPFTNATISHAEKRRTGVRNLIFVLSHVLQNSNGYTLVCNSHDIPVPNGHRLISSHLGQYYYLLFVYCCHLKEL